MRKRLPLFLLVICAAGFAIGLVYLFKLRFEIGDVYPPYSSLRSDPLGTMVLCESLERMPGLSVARDFSAQNQLPENPNTTYLHLAADPEDWETLPDELVDELQRFLSRGGRLAIAFYPQTSKTFSFIYRSGSAGTNSPLAKKKLTPGKKTGSDAPNSKKSADEPKSQLQEPAKDISLRKRWGIGFDFQALPQDGEGGYEPVRVVRRTALPLPRALDWHSGLVLTNLDASWRTIYTRGTNPVVVERKVGSGSIVMATDSFFLSNEAMLKDRHADLLAWLVGASQHVVFDEAHLGIVEEPSVSLLMRKYRLAGVLCGLVLLAGLFIWKNSVSLAPQARDEVTPEYVVGQEAGAGFVNLLRRNIAPQDILRTCFDEWTRSLAQGAHYSLPRVDRAQSILEAENARPPRERNSLRTYQEICQALKGRKNPP